MRAILFLFTVSFLAEMRAETIPTHTYETVMTKDTFMIGDDFRLAHNGKCELKLQLDGDLVVKKMVGSERKIAWRTFTGQEVQFLPNDLKFYLQGDRNMVIYGNRMSSVSSSSDVLWRSRTNENLPGFNDFNNWELRFDEECRLVLVGLGEYIGPIMDDCADSTGSGSTKTRTARFFWASVRNRDEEIYVRGFNSFYEEYWGGEHTSMNYPEIPYNIVPQGIIINNIWGGDNDRDLSLIVTESCQVLIFRGNDLTDLTSATVVWKANPNFVPVCKCYLYASHCDISLHSGEYHYPYLENAPKLWSYKDDESESVTCGNDRGFVIGFNEAGFKTEHMSWCGTPQFGYPWW